jgi:hypothetical protein
MEHFGGRVRSPKVRLRPLGDSRYGTLHAGKLPLIRDGARFALRLAGVGLRRLGEGRQVPHTRVRVHNTCPLVFPYVLELMRLKNWLASSRNQKIGGQA